MSMSYDLAVWFPHKPLSDTQAGEVYHQLCRGIWDSITPHPAVDSFYEELISIYPEIDTIPEAEIDNMDLCPWS
jgi:hypothetical protein